MFLPVHKFIQITTIFCLKCSRGCSTFNVSNDVGSIFIGSKKIFRAFKCSRLLAWINSWCIKPISQDGKEVFINSVLQAILAYEMSCFLLLKILKVRRGYIGVSVKGYVI
ncbi:hypothetical protein EPI10_023470 [Gossypium australe]|uniref:Uncharacterized protein n=1 Tax=Gossypium australe TaxID=47621 RepID=A0A5B6VUX3_9ROSI|nr:hypothetical protein EPI10_023470 [Gossypium australe]